MAPWSPSQGQSSHQGIAFPSQLSRIPLCFSERTGSTDNNPRTLVSTVRSACKGKNETPPSFQAIQQHPLGLCAVTARLLPPKASREPQELGQIHNVGVWLGICTAGLDGGGLGWEASHSFNPNRKRSLLQMRCFVQPSQNSSAAGTTPTAKHGSYRMSGNLMNLQFFRNGAQDGMVLLLFSLFCWIQVLCISSRLPKAPFYRPEQAA